MIVQAYRTFRRTVDQYERPYEAYRAIAQAYEWPTSLVQSEVSRRRKQVNRYIKQRLHLTILTLATEGGPTKPLRNVSTCMTAQ